MSGQLPHHVEPAVLVEQEVLEDPSDTTYDNIPIENQVFIETTDHIDIKNEPVDEY